MATASARKSWTPPCTCSTRWASACSTSSPTPAWSRSKSTANCCRPRPWTRSASNRIALKSPLTTPVGEGFSSINVELRKRFDLYANVRPAKSFPNTKSRFPSGVDLITVRENTEGAYIGEGQALSEDGETATC